jgi:hypothetical protein
MRLVAATSLLLFTAGLCGQTLFEPLGKLHLPHVTHASAASVFADFDRDGDADLFLGTTDNEQDRLYLNRGDGVFADVTEARVPTEFDGTMAVAAADIDGDGDLDVLTLRTRSSMPHSPLRILVNDGKGSFTDESVARGPTSQARMQVLVASDVDGDGDPDLVLGTSAGNDVLFVNDGKGFFQPASAALPPVSDQTYAIAMADVDGDRDPDLVLADFYQARLWLNDGKGVFQDASAALGTLSYPVRAVTAFDADGDAAPDLVLAVSEETVLLRNDGKGRFTRSTTPLPAASRDSTYYVAGDLDGDRDNDLVVVFDYTRPALVLENDGSGRFTDETARWLATTDGSRHASLLDVDADGDLDLFVARLRHRSKLFLNTGLKSFADGTLSPAEQPDNDPANGAFAVTDVNGDGWPDVVVSSDLSGESQVLVNDGTGGLVRRGKELLPWTDSESRAVTAGDVDGDGDPDLVFGNKRQFSTRDLLFVNDGTGRFTDVSTARMPARPDGTSGVALANVDGDGDLDLLTFGPTSTTNVFPCRLYLNDGKGDLNDDATNRAMPALAGYRAAGFAVADFDGDRDVDVVLAGNPDLLFLANDGKGSFGQEPSRLPKAPHASVWSMVAGDVDRNGGIDLIVATSAGHWLYHNDGRGTFTVADTDRLPRDTNLRWMVALGDVDGDGDLDLYSKPAFGEEIWLNDGSGRFRQAPGAIGGPNTLLHSSAIFCDTDRDGDADLLISRTYPQAVVLRSSLFRQAWTPDVVRVGRAWRLAISSLAGVGKPQVALPMLAFGTSSLPIPFFGRFGLDPATLVFLLPEVLDAKSGRATLAFPIPNELSLYATLVATQTLVLPDAGDLQTWRLTNTTTDRIVR